MAEASTRPLAGRTALVTGVSRRRGIGHGIALRLARDGANVVISHWAPHDDDQPWGGDDLDELRAELGRACGRDGLWADYGCDLAEPGAPEELMRQARNLTGHVDVLVCNHARSGSDGSIFDMTEETLSGHFDVNTRSTIMLTKAFAYQFVGHTERARPGDFYRGEQQRIRAKVVWLTSGQLHGPMPGEVAYATSKAALAGVTATVADELIGHGIALNTINPGPVNTGYLDPDSTDRRGGVIETVLAKMPQGRFGEPADIAKIVSWLLGPESDWIVGQTLTSDGGFSLR